MANIVWDTSEFDAGLDKLVALVELNTKKAINDIATEVLRLSQFEVPHNIGTLQNSGHVEPGDNENEKIVGYNTVYAAKLHENPQFNFQAGRKGKYLEDPIRVNLETFQNYFKGLVGE